MFEDVKKGYDFERILWTGEVENSLGFNLDGIALPGEFSIEGIRFNSTDPMSGPLENGEPLSRTRAHIENLRCRGQSPGEPLQSVHSQPCGAIHVAGLGSANSFVAFAILDFVEAAELLGGGQRVIPKEAAMIAVESSEGVAGARALRGNCSLQPLAKRAWRFCYVALGVIQMSGYQIAQANTVAR